MMMRSLRYVAAVAVLTIASSVFGGTVVRTVHNKAQFKDAVDAALAGDDELNNDLVVTFAADYPAADVITYNWSDDVMLDCDNHKITLDASACPRGRVRFDGGSECGGFAYCGDGSQFKNITFSNFIRSGEQHSFYLAYGGAIDYALPHSGDVVADKWDDPYDSDSLVLNCDFEGCKRTNQRGGAIGGCTTVAGCSFTNCVSWFDGGAVAGCKNVNNCTFISCSAGNDVPNNELYSHRGGGAVSEAVTITGCTFTDCVSCYPRGGAIFIDNNSLITSKPFATISNCQFTRCESSGTGCGGAIAGRVASITGCSFTDCKAREGGAVYGENSGKPAVDMCRFTRCKATGQEGGAISVSGDVTNSSFDDCSAVDDGGAINEGGQILNCRFTDCESKNGQGGALHDTGQVADCHFTACAAPEDGGGAIAGDMTIVRCEFRGCTSANDYGGAIQGGKDILSCLFVDCTAACGGAISEWSTGGEDLRIAHCTFVRCNGGVDNEAIYERNNGYDLNVYDCIFYLCDRWVDTGEIDYYACCYHIDTPAFFVDYANNDFHPNPNMPSGSMGQELEYQKPGSGLWYESRDIEGFVYNSSADWGNCPGCYRYRNQSEWSEYAQNRQMEDCYTANPFVVTTTEDSYNLYDGKISLREALHYVVAYTGSAYPDRDRIAFAVSGPVAVNATLELSSSGQLVIDGAGTKIVFNNNNGSYGMTITGGMVTLRNLDISASNYTAGSAVLYFNNPYGKLAVETCRFHNCACVPLLSSASQTTITRCTFDHNDSLANGAGVQIGGSALASAYISYSTFCENRSSYSGAFSGGVSVAQGALATCLNCTFTGNSATGIENADDFYNPSHDASKLVLVNCISTGSCNPAWITSSSSSLGMASADVFATGEAISRTIGGITRIGYLPKHLGTARNGAKIADEVYDVFGVIQHEPYYSQGSCFVGDQDPVPYIDANGNEQNCIQYRTVTADTLEFRDGCWYVVPAGADIYCESSVVTGTTHIILCDGGKFSVGSGLGVWDAGDSYPGIGVPPGSSLTMYGQRGGTGRLVAKGTGTGPGIGSCVGYRTACGNITINGGIIEAYGTEGGAGIGGGAYRIFDNAPGGNITVNGGYVKASGSKVSGVSVWSAGIGCGYNGLGHGTLTVGENMLVFADNSPNPTTAKARETNGTIALNGEVYYEIRINELSLNPFCVTTTNDVVDVTDGKVSLREAIAYLSSYTGAEYSKSNITFAVDGPVIVNSPIGAIAAQDSLTIDGCGAKIVFDYVAPTIAMMFTSGDITLRNLEISAPNMVHGDAVVFNSQSNNYFTVEDCRFHDCACCPLATYSFTLVQRCTFDHNHSQKNGAGILVQRDSAFARIEACTFCENTSEHLSAGVSVCIDSDADCVNCTFTGNHAVLANADDFYNENPASITPSLLLINTISTGAYRQDSFDAGSSSIGMSPAEVFQTGMAVTNVVGGITRIGYRPKYKGTARNVWDSYCVDFDIFGNAHQGACASQGSYFIDDSGFFAVYKANGAEVVCETSEGAVDAFEAGDTLELSAQAQAEPAGSSGTGTIGNAVLSALMTKLQEADIDWASLEVNDGESIKTKLNAKAAPQIVNNAGTDLSGTAGTVYIAPANIKPNLWYAIEHSTDVEGPYVIESGAWVQADADGVLQSSLAAPKTDGRHFYRVVASVRPSSVDE